MTMREVLPAPPDTRTRRQIEEYRRKSQTENGAAAVLGVLNSLPAFKTERKRNEAPSPREKASLKPSETTERSIEIPLDRPLQLRVVEGESGPVLRVEYIERKDVLTVTDPAFNELAQTAGKKIASGTYEVQRSELVFDMAKGEMEKVAKVLQRHFKVIREYARNLGRGKESRQVTAVEVATLNAILRKANLRTTAHMATCPSRVYLP